MSLVFVIDIGGGDSVFYAGDTISGRVKIHTSKKRQLKGIYLSFIGRADVCWTAGSGNSSVRYSSWKQYFNHEVTLWGGDGDKQFLQPGDYQFPFSFELLKVCLPATYKSCIGQVRYWLEAHMGRPRKWITKRGVTVSERVDLNLSKEDLVAARHADNQKTLGFWCCATGPLTLTASINHAGYCPGENILVTARVENNTNKTMKGVVVTLRRRISCFVNTYCSSWLEFVFQIQSNDPIPAGDNFEWNLQPLPIPSCPPSSHTCGIVHTDYELDFEVVTPFFNTHLHQIIPIVIGTEPLQSVNASVTIPTIGWRRGDQMVNIADSRYTMGEVEYAPLLPVLQLSQDGQQSPQYPRDQPTLPPRSQPRSAANPRDPPTQPRTTPNHGDPPPRLPRTQPRSAANPRDPHTQLRTTNHGDPPSLPPRTQPRSAASPRDPPTQPRTTNHGDPPPPLPRTQPPSARNHGDPPTQPRTTPNHGYPPAQPPPIQPRRALHPAESFVRTSLAPNPAA